MRILLPLLLLVATLNVTVAQKQNVDVLIKSGSLIDVRTGKILPKKIIVVQGK
ncbi:hypothetical protein [Spirosoma endophyticum]|uniref:Uncharacterized protein n=1 Tax=Spirosoma endophyticum TaxID=662367 RepID=A0A1I1MJW5_9BACT|nr:hypothetical protein [Spirosoma endophyticum]SFC83428.1 hypothetical protein SAMN05216167_102539 [Spirosoma endophyticum]